MNVGNSIYKIPDGKLIKIELHYDNNAIDQVKITGDFFAYPESSIEGMEKMLAGLELNEEQITQKIDDIIKIREFELFGLNPAGIARAIMMCVENS